MIAPSSIQQVQSVSIVDIIGRYTKLKQKGQNWSGNCPLHNEKTPSFVVSESKGIFKCFGCGKGGGVIQFVMAHEHKNFVEAVETIAGIAGITLQYDTNFDREAYDKLQQEKKSYTQLMIEAHDAYRQCLFSEAGNAARDYLNLKRHYDDDVITTWGLGYVPLNFRFLADRWKNTPNSSIAEQAGLLTSKEDSTYRDFFIDRIIYPIHNERSELVSFAGRILQEPSEYAKYMNGRQTVLFNKSATLYGLDKAIPAISKLGYATVVEGYHDVISLHTAGLYNAVAPCGTALTIDQVRLLKRYTKSVLLIPDNDSAGMKAASASLELLVQNGFHVEILPIDAETGKDADDLAQRFFKVPEYEAA